MIGIVERGGRGRRDDTLRCGIIGKNAEIRY